MSVLLYLLAQQGHVVVMIRRMMDTARLRQLAESIVNVSCLGSGIMKSKSTNPRISIGAKDEPQGSAINPTLTTVTASQSDKTATGTYALETITSLTNLRQSMTTTVTTSPTSSGSAVETAVAVVLAGGVIWILAGN